MSRWELLSAWRVFVLKSVTLILTLFVLILFAKVIVLFSAVKFNSIVIWLVV